MTSIFLVKLEGIFEKNVCVYLSKSQLVRNHQTNSLLPPSSRLKLLPVILMFLPVHRFLTTAIYWRYAFLNATSTKSSVLHLSTCLFILNTLCFRQRAGLHSSQILHTLIFTQIYLAFFFSGLDVYHLSFYDKSYSCTFFVATGIRLTCLGYFM